MAAIVLWPRLLPDRVCFEQINERMQERYDLLEAHRTADACDAWWQVWEWLKDKVTPERNTLEALDEDFRGTQAVFNWCQDFEMELGNAGIDDPEYHRLRVRYCQEFLETFSDIEWLMRGNFLRAEAESYWRLGEIETAEARFEALIEANPDWVWGYIGWSDEYWLFRNSPKDYRYAPSRAPARDPLERAPKPVRECAVRMVLAPALRREQVICQFLRDAPHLVSASGLGAATCAITLWPHQQIVARQVLEGFPARYLLADEVGLGKTIEAGLVLRQLRLSGIVRRALILAPKSVLRQWQEELYEKFALNVPIYDGAVLRDIWGQERAPTTQNPWDGVDLALASSQLVKRRERQGTLIEARPMVPIPTTIIS